MTNTDTRRLVLLDAPSNLGLRPPVEGAVPGCYKAPGALRDTGLLARLGAEEGGVVTPPRYVATWQPGDGVRNAAAIAAYTRALAERIGAVRERGGFPVVLGGECSIVLGGALALRRTGRYGLAYLDAHDDFRHLGNAPHVGSAGGEAVALATGRGADELADIDGLRPYVRDEDVVVLGAREHETVNVLAEGVRAVSSRQILRDGPAAACDPARQVLDRPDLDGFWVHVDIDVLDPSVVSAVDSPDPEGLDADTLVEILRDLLSLPGAAGFELTVFDPDLDPDGAQAALVADIVARTLHR